MKYNRTESKSSTGESLSSRTITVSVIMITKRAAADDDDAADSSERHSASRDCHQIISLFVYLIAENIFRQSAIDCHSDGFG